MNGLKSTETEWLHQQKFEERTITAIISTKIKKDTK